MRFIEAVAPREAEGVVAQVYGEVKRDFGLLRDPDGNSPFLAHSPHPELLAGFWSLLYETTLVVGAVPRADKEAIASAVSRANDCPFCVEAHALLSGVAGTAGDRRALVDGTVEGIGDPRRRKLVEWAAATREPACPLLRAPPFGVKEAPEVIGTALCFHYVNRMVEVLQGHGAMNIGPAPVRGVIGKLVGGVAGRALRRERKPGRTVALQAEAELPADLGWARPSPMIAAAMARFAAAVERAGEQALAQPARTRLLSVLSAWEGTDPPLHGAWIERALDGLEPSARPTARLGLLAALAPHRVDDAAVEAFRRVRASDRDLVSAVSWPALVAARRIASWLSPHASARAQRPPRSYKLPAVSERP